MTTTIHAPLRERLEAAGARFGKAAGFEIARHFGDAGAEYESLSQGAGLVPRSDRAILRMWGRDPVRMLQGLCTNDIATAPSGRAVYGAILTPKGRMLADMRAVRREGDEGVEVVFDVAREALAGLSEHLKRFVPPMFARWEVADDRYVLLGLHGPDVDDVSGGVLGAEAAGLEEDESVPMFDGRGCAIGTAYAGGGVDLLVPADATATVWGDLVDGGARPAGFSALETRRIEEGRPRYGPDMSEKVIATEAFEATGQMERAISFSKGCYTGQEVIIRIAHRGRVNRHLAGLLLGDAPTPPCGAELSHPETGKGMGWVTSAAASPRMKQTIALGYVRREREPGDAVLLDGREATVTTLPFREE